MRDQYILSLIYFVRMDFSEQSLIEGEDWDVRSNQFRAKHIDNSMFIEDLVMWRRDDNVTLENSVIMLISH